MILCQKKRNKNRGDADQDKPFVVDVSGRMKNMPFSGQFVVKLLNQRLKFRPFEL